MILADQNNEDNYAAILLSTSRIVIIFFQFYLITSFTKR